MKTARLKSLVGSLKNGAWGDECEDDTGTYCIRAADFDYVRLRASLDRAPKRAYPATVARDIRLQPGDLVLEKSGGGENQPVGRAVLYDRDEPAVATNFAARLRPAPGVDPKYLTYVLAGLYASGATERCIKQTTGIQNLDTQAWLQTPVPEPDLETQRRIADFLDDQVARIEEIIRLREEQRSTLRERFAVQCESALDTAGELIALRRVLRQSPSYGVLKPEHDGSGDGVPLVRIFNVESDGYVDASALMRVTPAQDREFRRTRLHRTTSSLALSARSVARSWWATN